MRKDGYGRNLLEVEIELDKPEDKEAVMKFIHLLRGVRKVVDIDIPLKAFSNKVCRYAKRRDNTIYLYIYLLTKQGLPS